MSTVFVSYRRADAGGHSRRLAEALRGYFGEQVFKDTDSLRGGVDFAAELRRVLATSHALLALIGPGWAQRDTRGRARLDDPADWVRTEIATALRSDVLVIPVLLPDAVMPAADRLPADIRALTALPVHRVRAEEWAQDVEALAAAVKTELDRRGRPRPVTRIEPRTAHALTRVAQLAGHSGGVSDVVFTANGLRVVSAGGAPAMRTFGRLSDGADVASLGDRTAREWRVADGSLVRTLRGHRDWVVAVAASPDGGRLASGDGDTVLVWGPDSATPIRELRGQRPGGTAIDFAPDGSLLAAGSADGATTLWRVADGTAVAGRADHRGAVTCVRFSPDGTVVASGARDATVRLWYPGDARRSTTLRTGSRWGASPGAVRGLAFSPSGEVVAAACHDGRVRRWRVADGAPVAGPLALPAGWASSVAFSPDGAQVAAGSSTGRLLVWPVAGGEPVDLDTGATAVDALAFSPDGSMLAVGTWDHTLSLWRIPPVDRRRL